MFRHGSLLLVRCSQVLAAWSRVYPALMCSAADNKAAGHMSGTSALLVLLHTHVCVGKLGRMTLNLIYTSNMTHDDDDAIVLLMQLL
mmetsp:Transcript_31464/g.70051  ORF Transcript_31464/g.70051 Transcript_31464/m.70051 type:complete len:87 (+) Transcript_31464:395-655(+)